MSQVDFNRYLEFVDGVTSEPSKDTEAFVYRVQELAGQDCEIQRLLTAAVGLSAEAGEFLEIVKKIAFQGKEYSPFAVYHMKRELGDIMWYMAQGCKSLNTNFDELVEMNVEKLEARYPGGSFNVHSSEVRVEGDI